MPYFAFELISKAVILLIFNGGMSLISVHESIIVDDQFDHANQVFLQWRFFIGLLFLSRRRKCVVFNSNYHPFKMSVSLPLERKHALTGKNIKLKNGDGTK